MFIFQGCDNKYTLFHILIILDPKINSREFTVNKFVRKNSRNAQANLLKPAVRKFTKLVESLVHSIVKSA